MICQSPVRRRTEPCCHSSTPLNSNEDASGWGGGGGWHLSNFALMILYIFSLYMWKSLLLAMLFLKGGAGGIKEKENPKPRIRLEFALLCNVSGKRWLSHGWWASRGLLTSCNCQHSHIWIMYTFPWSSSVSQACYDPQKIKAARAVMRYSEVSHAN